MSKLWLILLLLCAALLGATSQILFRKSNATFDRSIFSNWTLILGVFLMGVAFLINLYAYQQSLGVMIVYPTLAASYVFAVLLAWMILGEGITASKVTGASLIALGIVTIWL